MDQKALFKMIDAFQVIFFYQCKADGFSVCNLVNEVRLKDGLIHFVRFICGSVKESMTENLKASLL